LFPHGTLGWGVIDTREHVNAIDFDDTHQQVDAEVTTKQIMYYRMHFLQEQHFRLFEKLANEYAVNMLTCDLETRLNYIHANQRWLCEANAKLMNQPFVTVSQNI
jgi:hypothetical protein